MLDMGEPVRIADVAAGWPPRRTTPVEIVYTGLRPGEKLHEHLFGDRRDGPAARCTRSSHTCRVPPLRPDRVQLIDPGVDPHALIAELCRLSQADLTPPTRATSARSAPGGVVGRQYTGS